MSKTTVFGTVFKLILKSLKQNILMSLTTLYGNL